MHENKHKYRKSSLILIAFCSIVLLVSDVISGTRESSQEISAVSFSNNLLGKLENISDDCKQTKGSDIQNSKCFYQLSLITEIYTDALSIENSTQLQNVLAKIDNISLDIYTRNQQYLLSKAHKKSEKGLDVGK